MSTLTEPQPSSEPGREVRRIDEFLVWSALVLPIGLWMTHLSGVAALVQLSCTHPSVHWVLHALTAGLAILTIACMLVALRYVRWPNGETAGSSRASLRFLSRVAVLVGAFNLVLILWEGSYVVFLHSCHGR